MKKLVYIFCVLLLIVGCTSHQKSSEDIGKDTVVIAPDSVWNYSRLDSIDHVIKSHSYQTYGDSNLLEEGLPDSMKLHNHR